MRCRGLLPHAGSHGRPRLDILLLAQKTLNFRLQFLGVRLISPVDCKAVFNKAFDQQVLKVCDSSPFLRGK